MTKHERVTLAEFLGRLEEEPAAEARAAAARIDELSRIGNAMEGIEHRFLPWAVVAAAAFVASNWSRITPIVPWFLDAVSLAHKAMGTWPMSTISGAIWGVSNNYMPLWNSYMPRGAKSVDVPAAPINADAKKRVVYLPSCVTRMKSSCQRTSMVCAVVWCLTRAASAMSDTVSSRACNRLLWRRLSVEGYQSSAIRAPAYSV